MEITPTQIRAATFKTSRKGYDPDDVRAYLGQVAQTLEECQQHATAMEARARAAVSRLQEFQAAAAAEVDVAAAPAQEAAPAASVPVAADEAETISRTLLLAQRTADTTVAEAQAEAERLKAEAKAEAESTLDSTREMSAKMIEDARTEARDASAEERQRAESEVEQLRARREFLVGDVDQLETFLVDQRERLRGAARQIEALCERVPSGLGEVRRPPLSAADDADSAGALFQTPGASAPFDASVDDDGGPITGETPVQPGLSIEDDATQPMPAVTPTETTEAASDAGADTAGEPHLPLSGGQGTT